MTTLLESLKAFLSDIAVPISLLITLGGVITGRYQKNKEVASKVFIWWDKNSKYAKKGINVFQISNHSNEPVHNVVVDIEYGKNYSTDQNHSVTIGILPPGDFIIYYDQHIEVSMFKKVIPVIYFVDSANRKWKRNYNGKLARKLFDISKNPQKVPAPQTDLPLKRIK